MVVVILALVLVVGVLFGAGTYLVLHRTLTRIVLGFGFWGYGVNVLLLLSGGRAGAPPLIDDVTPETAFVDPLPQAMALTAIVITFAITAFLLALAYRSWTLTGDDEVEDDIEDRRIAALGRGRPAEAMTDGDEPA
ncbi:MAG: Na(+)/H(+) antiporter subunit C [Vicinamibacterales bacterium]